MSRRPRSTHRNERRAITLPFILKADTLSEVDPRFSYQLSVVRSLLSVISDLGLGAVLVDQSLEARVLPQRVPGWIELKHRDS